MKGVGVRCSIIILVLVVYAVQPVGAVTLNHDAEDGIVAIAQVGSVGELLLPESTLLLLTEDGTMHIVDSDGKIAPYHLPNELETTWPVEFSEIVEWIPLALASSLLTVYQGLVVARDGSRWIQCVDVKSSWDVPGEPEVSLRWKRLVLSGN